MTTVTWSDEVQAVVKGDLAIAAAYPTPAGGAVVTGVSPVGMADRESARLTFTTSLGMAKKLEHILARPRVSLAYHAREHGFAESTLFVLAQGRATVDMDPGPHRVAELVEAAGLFLGPGPRGPLWDRLLREYNENRVFVDVHVERLTVWPDLAARGVAQVTGPPAPAPAPEQVAPKNGTAPRVDVPALRRRVSGLGHRLLAYQGADGRPVIVPVGIADFDPTGVRLDVPPGLLPAGGRRAGFLAHRFGPRCVGLGTRTLTGWLTVDDEGAVYAPHTSRGLNAPANKTVQTVATGLAAKVGLRRARRDGTLDRLRSLAHRQ